MVGKHAAGPGVLRLPDGITTCLFDLDGVRTRTVDDHAEPQER